MVYEIIEAFRIIRIISYIVKTFFSEKFSM